MPRLSMQYHATRVTQVRIPGGIFSLYRLKPVLSVLAFCITLLLPGSAVCAKTTDPVVYVVANQSDTTVSFFRALESSFQTRKAEFKFVDLEKEPVPQHKGAIYISVGTRALEQLLNEDIRAPILAVFISHLSFRQILQADKTATQHSKLSAVYSDPSPLQQFYLIRHLFPNPPKTAVIVSNKTEFLVPELEHAAKQTDITLSISVQTEKHNIVKTLRDIQNADVILALPDSSVYNMDTIQRILLSAYRRNQSIIGFSRQLVSAGGLATVYSDASHIQSEAVKAVASYLDNGSLPPPAYSQAFDIEINERVAKSYNLVLPDKATLKKRIIQSLEACCDK